MKVLFAASEVVPFSKTGGLADVAGALPFYLSKTGCDIRIAVPLYQVAQVMSFAMEPVGMPFEIQIGPTLYAGCFFTALLKETVPVYFVRCDELYNREGLYGTAAGDYTDNAERFIFFSRAVLELCSQLDFSPDVLHCNDWQTGLIPAYVKAGFGMGRFDRTAAVFTIHNIAYQGLFDFEKFSLTGLPDWFYDMRGLEFWRRMSMLKAGIVFSRCVTTVSRQYAREIQTPEYGGGLEGVLVDRKDDLFGILNGVDYEEWNPASDPFIAGHYTSRDVSPKRACKKNLMAECGLSKRLHAAPLIGSISRLVDQKGFDLIAEAIEKILDLGACYIVLGTGDTLFEKQFHGIALRNKKRMKFIGAYDNRLAHKIEAGCDMFLMPSRYEPCGLNQIYSLKYGTVPIVRATGGLDDTIVDHAAQDGRTGTGFKFAEYTSAALFEAVERAIGVYKDAPRWRDLMLAGMSCDFSWGNSAAQYLRLYETACSRSGL